MKKATFALILFLIIEINPVKSQNTNFEGGWGDWYADNGTWDVGVPTAGPDSAYSPGNCAATNLSGYYSPDTQTRLISPYFTVPNASENPRLEYMSWHAYSFSDYGYVQVKEKGTADWINISEQVTWEGSNTWSKGQVLLEAFAGKEIQVAFFFSATDQFGIGGTDVHFGWYIDDILLKTGAIEFSNPQTWQSGWKDWHSDNDSWGVGVPTAGPDSAYSPGNCAGINLSGYYSPDTQTRLISPYFTVSNASENPRLEYMSWHSFSFSDYGYVQVKEKGTADWINISEQVTWEGSNTWSKGQVLLEAFAGKEIQVAFFFSATDQFGIGGTDVHFGWYIDDILLKTGAIEFSNPQTWQSGWKDWHSDNDSWGVGVPTAGPDSAYSPGNCAGINLSGYYSPDTQTRLISPYFTVPNASENPRLEYMSWHAFSFSDYGYVQVKEKGTADWINISEQVTWEGSNTWSKGQVLLEAFAGKEIQVAFFFSATDQFGIGGTDVHFGWYIDDILLKTGAIEFSNPQTWQSGWKDWHSDNDSWGVGVPTAGPDSAYSPGNCAGINLSGYYSPDTQTRLISPYFTVPNASENPKFEFYHWFAFSYSDYGNIQIRIKDSVDWKVVSTDFTETSSNSWTRYLLFLDDYANKVIQIAFFFNSTDQFGIGGSDVNFGWYIDNISFIGIPEQNVLSADFTAEVISGVVPLTVYFSDNSLPLGLITAWKWDLNNDGIIDSEEQNPSYTYNDPGIYDVKLIVTDGELSDSIIKEGFIEVLDTIKVGLSTFKKLNQVSVFPNPFKREINLLGKNLENSELEIYSLHGRLLFHGKIFANQYSVDLSEFDCGIYLLKIINRSEIFSIKIIKQ